MEASMEHPVKRIASYLKTKKHSIYKFLQKNGFFDEMVRGIVKIFFFIIILYFFKQVVW
jgi:hypothetical protein